MKALRILVTGGAGFIGSNLIHYLLGKASKELGIEILKVVNLDKLTYAGNLHNLRAWAEDSRLLNVEGDICDAELVQKLLQEHAITHVMHLAAESHVDRSIESPEAFVMTNVVGTFRMLEAARSYYKSLDQADQSGFRFLHVSTDEVYGSLQETDPAFSETTPYAPNSPYSASKASSDHFARSYFHTYHLPVIMTNCSNNYGPYQFPEKLIPLIISKARRGESLPIYGEGSNVRDWLYVEDHCRGLVFAMLNGRLGETYNLGGKTEQTNLEVVRAILRTLRECGVAVAQDSLVTFVTDRPGHDKRYAINCTKAEQELCWHPQEFFHTGLKKTIQWYLDNDDWVADIESGNYRGERLGLVKG